MKYNGFYFWLFSKPMKQVLSEKYNRQYANDIMKKSKRIYRELVKKADDIGDDNPMAYNELFALSFVAPQANPARNRAGNDAPLALSCEMVLWQN